MATDFMPIRGWDHLELYVGNAKQSAYFYEHAFGFTQTAYAGPETGVRDRASYVVDQNDIRLVLTSGLRPDSEITKFACAHGDGVKDVALTVPSATETYRQAVHRLPPHLRTALAYAMHPAFLAASGLCLITLTIVAVWLKEVPLKREVELPPEPASPGIAPQRAR